MRFRRDRDKPVNVITTDDVHEALQEAAAEFEVKSEFVDLDAVVAEVESEAEYRIELDVEPKTVAEPNPGFLFLAESLAVGVTANGFVITEPTGRRLSAFLADGGQLVLTVYDDEGEYRHIRLGSDGQQLLRSWLDQAAS
jgi:hypothetical protein